MMPSVDATSWREAIVDACARLHWAHMDYWGGEVIAPPGQDFALIAWTEPPEIEMYDATAILTSSMGDVVTETARAYKASFAEAIRLASQSMALASELIRAGGVPLAASETLNTFPLLGEIARSPSPCPTTIALASEPLAFYRTLPPLPGTVALWPPEVFFHPDAEPYSTGEGLTDLTGKARLLAFGPFVALTPGEWELSVDVSVAVEGAALKLKFDWGDGLTFEEKVVSFHKSGRFRIVLNRTWRGRADSQLRVWLHRAAFQGGFSIQGATCQKR